MTFFATGDVLSGLFALANYDMTEPDGVITPMGAGCASMVGYPLEQASIEKPHCVLGLFDVSARPHVGQNELTFTIPIKRFEQLVAYMDESFLITNSWEKVRSRIGGSQSPFGMIFSKEFYALDLALANRVQQGAYLPLELALRQYTNLYIRFGP